MTQPLQLDDADRARLSGEHGPGPALAMRILTSVATSMGAPRLIDIASAHVDGCFYVGEVSLDFARRLANAGARVAVPTTTNVGSVDRLHPQRWRGGARFAEKAAALMDVYASLGCRPTWTCAPYQLLGRPMLGQHVAWGESNAIVFANSVLGARTQRYGDFVDISAAVVGRAPLAGLHTDEGRLGQIRIDTARIDSRWKTSGVFFALLGHVVGRLAGSLVPVITGIDRASEDELKAFGAAAASTGAVALFHVVGITPEAATLRDCFGPAGPQQVVQVGVEDLTAAWRELGAGADGKLAAVCLGTPHFSLTEFRRLAELLGSDTVHPPTELIVSTGRQVWADVLAAGLGEPLTRAGVRVVTDTCMYNTPILGRVDGLILTNSAKFAWYAPANIGAKVVLAGLAECVRSAVAGRMQVEPLV